MQKENNTYNHQVIEKKWQDAWKKLKLYKARDRESKNYYLLVELTYTSGDLHMGHWFAWTAPDAFARMKRMQGENVLFPVGGFDAFGLPAENAAIKHGIHPRSWTYKNIETMRKQFEKMGLSFDWEKEVITSDPYYYKWTQWLFLQLFKSGLAYRGKLWSNWCPECKTVLANEHVVNACCWRHTSTPVEQKLIDQWLFRITEYADRLIWPEKPSVDWPKAAIDGQNNWIGRSEGIVIKFEIRNLKSQTNRNLKYIEVFTTAHDTIFGTSFVVLAPEYAKNLLESIPESNRQKVSEYIQTSLQKTQLARKEEVKSKSGVETGLRAINPVNGQEIPIYVSDYVLMEYGTGAVMGVPSHDTRDHEFAWKYNLPVKPVVKPSENVKSNETKIQEDGFWDYAEIKTKFSNKSLVFDSGFMNGLSSSEAKKVLEEKAEKEGWGKRQIQYHLRDWSVSRQRYWAAPVPMIYCEKCAKDGKSWFNSREPDWDSTGWFPVPEKDLPVTLPEKVDYTPTGKAPLATAKGWLEVKCPNCGRIARREAETLDTYVDSSWYFFRYLSPKYDKGPFDKKVINKWMPIKVYFGGPEHILGHTLYARFITKFLYDRGYIDFDEFALKRIHHGVILGQDGYRMSKSRGNVVNPDEQVKKFGADAVRLYICFLGPHDKGGAWKLEGIEGANRFLKRVWRLVTESHDLAVEKLEEAKLIFQIQHKTIQKVTNDIEKLQTNTAIAALMEFTNFLEDIASKYQKSNVDQKIHCAEWDGAIRTLVLLLAPFAPHMTEELWQLLKVPKVSKAFDTFDSIHLHPWPEYDPTLAKESKVTIVVQVDGRLRATVLIDANDATDKNKVVEMARRQVGVVKWLEGKSVKDTIFVPSRLINFVTG